MAKGHSTTNCQPGCCGPKRDRMALAVLQRAVGNSSSCAWQGLPADPWRPRGSVSPSPYLTPVATGTALGRPAQHPPYLGAVQMGSKLLLWEWEWLLTKPSQASAAAPSPRGGPTVPPRSCSSLCGHLCPREDPCPAEAHGPGEGLSLPLSPQLEPGWSQSLGPLVLTGKGLEPEECSPRKVTLMD